MNDSIPSIQSRKPSREELETMGVFTWPTWEKGKSVFPWVYTTDETCFIEEGRVKVTLKDGRNLFFEKGDFVVFPMGLECDWEILEPVTKRYSYA